MYNMLFGVNPLAGVLLKALDIGVAEMGRFRDIYLSGDGTKIILYTRNGGGNRECWEREGCPKYEYEGDLYINDDGELVSPRRVGDPDKPDIPENHNPSCLVYVNWRLTQHPLYIRDYDDGYDCTYAYFEFRVPDVLEPVLDRIMKEQGGPPKSVKEKIDEVVAEMESMTQEQLEADPRFGSLANLMKSIAEDKEPGVTVATVGPDGIEVKKTKFEKVKKR